MSVQSDPALSHQFEQSSTSSNFRWPEWIAIVFFAGIVAYAIPFHEPWADEAQAWQLARNLSLWDLLAHHVRYEGSPGFWHLFLWILIRCHITYAVLPWICGAIAVLSTSILVLKSPLPRGLKLTLPFTNFLLYQYAVIARSYVFAPLMLFLIAFCWNGNPLLVATLLGILANLSLHTAIIAGGLAVVFCFEWLRRWGSLSGFGRSKLISAFAIIAAFFAFSIWSAWPPADLLLSRVRGTARPFFAEAAQSLILGIPWPWILPLLIWAGVFVCLSSRRRLYYLLPVVLFAAFSGAVHCEWWHIGLLVPLLISILWITWPRALALPSLAPQSVPEKFGYLAVTLMVTVQIVSSVYAIAYDHSHAYSPDLATAQFLSPIIRNGAQVAVTHLGNEHETHDYHAVGILPYFDHNIYLNQPQAFWWWSEKNPTEQLFVPTLATRPKIVIVEARHLNLVQHLDPNDPKVALLRSAGYRYTNLFCGEMPISIVHGVSDCHLIFQYQNTDTAKTR